ncbi:acyl-CoA dehydratase activase [Fusibacter sp. 3D3]|uniref:acyl-CoA dehydratase activase n=1 Tax=Fusibacter sp. 3D3 TaxID=1048380 RepID=UPI0008529623|nr:acyl-CoA dehydratase activase [Fusibacter sp. 3D3]GAU75874.1 benzoyl-CoA reductase subunit BadG [Fusibacter sp. 3D3]
MKIMGIDSGSTTTKGVIFNGTHVTHTLIVPTSYNPKSTMENLQLALHKLSGDDEHIPVYTTGYGRDLLSSKKQSITEITCHGAGAAFLNADTTTVLDIGGQDSKVIQLDVKGNVIDFLMNDKCAAGTGRFIEVMMRTLHKDLLELDDLVTSHTPVKISSMCAVFAESEVISLLAKGIDPGDIALGVLDSICERSAHFVKRLNRDAPIFFSGGLAQSKSIKISLEKHLGVPVHTHEKAQLVGAIGAAVIGYRKLSASRL